VIVRISGEGQYSIDDVATPTEPPDSELEAAVNRNDECGFHLGADGLLDQVRARARRCPDTLEPSDLILPPQDASMDEVREIAHRRRADPG